MQSTANKFVLVWALALTAFMIMGVTIPNTFAPATVISSAQMNANFAALDTAVDALETKTAPGTQGNILGYAFIRADGSVSHSWMADGGTPTVSHTGGSGRYDITWPGETYSIFENAGFVTPTTAGSFVATLDDDLSGNMIVWTKNSTTGAAADPFGFFVMVLQDNLP